MEIGISSDMLIDIGLNAAGFICGGVILMLLSTFRRSRRLAVDGPTEITVPTPEKTTEPEKQEKTKVIDNPGFKGNFVNFNNVDWRDEPDQTSRTTESWDSTRNRREAIQMAKKMLADKKGESELKASLPVNDGELSYAKYLDKLSNTGRTNR